MTQQEIQQRNEEIARMLNLEVAGPGFPSGYFYENDYYHSGDLKFHSDWNWLMEVSIFIEKLEQNIGNKENFRSFNKVLSIPIGTDKELIFIAVSDFAKLYNEKKLV